MKDNKILLVTGASSDVGSLLINKVADNYENVLTHYRDTKSKIEELQERYGKKIIPLQADFSRIESTQKLIDEIKEREMLPDHIVHLSSGKVHNLQFHKQMWENYEREINTSLRSIVMICQQLIPHMSKQKYGKIVFMLSAYLFGVPPKYESPYITTKYALLGLMKNLAAEYAPKRIMVNAVSPDMMETKFLSELPALVKEQSAKNNPLGRNILIEEVVPTIEYFLSDASDVVTGQNVGVTGGRR